MPFHKQGRSGDNTGILPDPFDFVGTAKYEAWAELNGDSGDDAMRRRVTLVDQLLS